MRRVLPSILIVVVLFIHFTPMVSLAEEVTLVRDGFMTGNDFMALSSGEQSKYAMGLVDGMFLAPLFKAPKASMYWFENCVVGMTNKQVVAMLRKELESNPGTWHYSVHTAMYRAMLDGCPGSPIKTK